MQELREYCSLPLNYASEEYNRNRLQMTKMTMVAVG